MASIFEDMDDQFLFRELILTTSLELNPDALTICQEILQKRTDDGFEGEVCVNKQAASNYDDYFERMADCLSLDMLIDRETGVYTLGEPYMR